MIARRNFEELETELRELIAKVIEPLNDDIEPMVEMDC